MQSESILIDSHFHEPRCSFPAINAGCSADDLKERLEKFGGKDIFFGAAMGPWETENRSVEDIDSQFEILKGNIEKYSPLFIGETGLDYYWSSYGKPEIQMYLFEKHLSLAESLDKRVLIHSREAAGDTVSIIKNHSCTGVIHCCDGNPLLIKEALDKGYFISFAGNITYKANQHLRDALKTVPSDRLLLETDAPYLSPVPFRGKPNCSDNIIYTYKCAAEILGITEESLAEQVYRNFLAFTGK